MSLRTSVSFPFPESDLQTIKNKMLNWLRPFSIFAYLDNNKYRHDPVRYEMLAAAAPVAVFSEADEGLGDWVFGHLAYDYKNHIEPRLSSRFPDTTGFHDHFFFQPDIVVYIPHGTHTLYVSALTRDPDTVLKEILQTAAAVTGNNTVRNSPMQWQHGFDEAEYIRAVQDIRQHIEEGDCYEMNFCTKAFATEQDIDPVATFHQLNTVNPSPFAALYRNDQAWLMCASPERFLYREKTQVLSQPIKGTSRRSSDPETDRQLRQALLTDSKERAENVMIVDLVRNDLARSCVPGSITVPELFGVYSFPQVHQLISTVQGTLQPAVSNQQILEHAFPMGSMTGVPKIMVMQLTEQYERARRGLYAGTVGYITPSGDFDFNVVIRSLQYNADTQYLSYQTGGAITYASDPASEWAEVRLKAAAMEQIFL